MNISSFKEIDFIGSANVLDQQFSNCASPLCTDVIHVSDVTGLEHQQKITALFVTKPADSLSR